MSGDDRDPLLEEETPRWRRRSSVVCMIVFLVGLVSLVSAILVGYFTVIKNDTVALKVMSLNTWGMPHTFGSQDKEARMVAIGQYINQSQHDVYMLEELWMRPDYETIKQHLPTGWFMSDYSEMTHGKCDGVLAPDGCSGLSIISRFPFIDQSFTMFTDHGSASHFWDGESLASKGVGRVRIEPAPGHIVDVFWTHTAASDYNGGIREKQVKQLVGLIKQSDADFVILGGDFNSDPVVNSEETTLRQIQEVMVSAVEEFFKKLKSWIVPREATYGNPKNSYSYTYQPVHYDYIFHKANGDNRIMTNFFDVPIFKFSKDSEHIVSFSDHEAVTAHLYLLKHKSNS